MHGGTVSQRNAATEPMMLLIVSDMARYPDLRETIQIPFEMVAAFSQIIMRYQAEGNYARAIRFPAFRRCWGRLL